MVSARLSPRADPGLGRLPRAVSHSFPKTTRPARLLVMLAVGLLALGVSGCGLANRTTLTGVSQNELSAGGEPYFNVGPITYQVQESRALNPFLPDDAQYFTGVSGAQNLSPDQLWLGVFLWAKNQTSRLQTTTDTFKIVDSAGTVYPATPLDATMNPYAWSAQQLPQNGIEPAAGTTASAGPTGGGLVLFKLNDSIYSNRPLTLEIFAPGSTKPSKVSLDL